MNRFSTSEVTQNIMCKDTNSDSHIKLRNVYNPGYIKCLEKSYMQNLKNILEEYMSKYAYFPDNCERFLFICDSKEVARQACQIVRNYKYDNQKNNAEFLATPITHGKENEFGYSYENEIYGLDMMDANSDANCEVLVILEKPEKKLVPEGFITLESIEMNEKSSAYDLDTAENVHIELGAIEDPDEAVHKVLSIQNENVSVWVKNGKSCDYLKKRLRFEGEYIAIELTTPTAEDLLSYAKDYLSVHCFKYKEKDIERMLQKLKCFRGELFTEKDIYTHLGRCMETAMMNKKRTLKESDLALNLLDVENSSKQELDSVIGLENVKKTFERIVAAQRFSKLSNDSKVKFHRNLIFAGNPGTGKSKLARIYASLLSEYGLGNGRFVDASKSDIVGKYLGHTAHLLREQFKKAEGGVLFIDEASFLLSKDDFVKEAVVEFVRYMELYPETIVIFATYKKEAEQLLEIDSGFRSRISKVVVFENYSEAELWEIFKGMAEMYGFNVSNKARKSMCEYIEKIKNTSSFANAREVRKLVETSIEEYGLEAALSNTSVIEDEEINIITDNHVKLAAEYLLKERKEPNEKRYGFAV